MTVVVLGSTEIYLVCTGEKVSYTSGDVTSVQLSYMSDDAIAPG